MIIGVLKEIKDNENRVALTPIGAAELIRHGHSVRVELGAGVGSGFSDEEYLATGAYIVNRDEAWQTDLILKVKEPLSSEYQFFRQGQMIFTYLHLAGVDPSLTAELLDKRVTAIAYETVTGLDGKLPLLLPMSAVAGRMAIYEGAHYLAKPHGGNGILLSGVDGVEPGTVVVVGAGVVGSNAIDVAVGCGAKVIALDVNHDRLNELRNKYPSIETLESSSHNIADAAKKADILVGAVLLAGAKAPFLVTEEMVKSMKTGSVIVDVAIDQGGSVQTSRPTKHSDPIFVKHGVTHYCVTNMPGAYPRTSTFALTKATLPYAIKIANNGIEKLIRDDIGIADGINTFDGFITNRPVAQALGLSEKYKSIKDFASAKIKVEILKSDGIPV